MSEPYRTRTAGSGKLDQRQEVDSMSHPTSALDQPRLQQVLRTRTVGWTSQARDIDSYLAAQVDDASERNVIGPLLAASGGSGVVLHGGREVGRWGDPAVPEMAFSATKSVVSVVAGVAYDTGLLIPDQRVREVLDLPEFAAGDARDITWDAAASSPVSRRTAAAARSGSTASTSTSRPSSTGSRSRGGAGSRRPVST